MLKSNNQSQNNVYRIVKVLTSQDYLVVDQNQQYHILAPSTVYSSTSMHTVVKSDYRSANIVQPLEQLKVQHLKYLVFPTQTNRIVWVKDISHQYLKDNKFIRKLITTAITNILETLLLMTPAFALSIIHMSNFWLLDGQLYLLRMPRTISLHKTQSKRSQSLQNNPISTIIDKQMTIIKKLAEILNQIIMQNEKSILWDQQRIKWKNLLTKMINKQLSFQQILSQIRPLKNTGIDSRIKKYRYESPLRKQLFQRKKKSQPLALQLKETKKKRNSLNNLSDYSYSTFSNRPQSKKRSSTMPIPQDQKKLIQYNLNLMQKRKIKTPTQTLSCFNFNYETPTKSFSTPKKNIFSRHSNQKDDRKYLNWLKINKYSNVSSLPIQMTKQNPKNYRSTNIKTQAVQKQSNIDHNGQQLKRRLLSKIGKYRASRYNKSVYTQTIDRDIQHFCPISNDVQKYSTIQNLQEQKTLTRILSFQKLEPFKQKKQELSQSLIRPTFKLLTQRSNYQEQNLLQSSNNREIESYQIPSQITSNIQRISKYSKPQNSVLNQPKHTKVQIPSKQPKIKNIKMIAEEIDLEDIETISFGPQLSKHTVIVPKPSGVKNNNMLQKHPFDSQSFANETEYISRIPQESIKPQKSDQQCLKQIKSALQEYISMINILADSCVNCVKTKASLKNTKWRLSVYFIYERFLWQRVEMLKHLKSNQIELVSRKKTVFQAKCKQLWSHGSESIKLIQQVQKENINIKQTYERLAKKVVEECQLQPNILKFIQNRDELLERGKVTVRPFLSKYAIAFIINEYDELLQKSNKNDHEISYVLRCIFSLRIIAELDDKSQKNKSLQLSQYHKKHSLEELSEIVESIYNLYYPESPGS